MTLEIRKSKMIRDFTVSQPFQILSNISGKHQVFVWMDYIFQSMWLRCAGAKQVEEQTIDLDLQMTIELRRKVGCTRKTETLPKFPNILPTSPDNWDCLQFHVFISWRTLEGSGNGEIKTAFIWDFFQTEDVYHFEFSFH